MKLDRLNDGIVFTWQGVTYSDKPSVASFPHLLSTNEIVRFINEVLGGIDEQIEEQE